MLQTDSARQVATIIIDGEPDIHVPALCDIDVIAAIRRALTRKKMSSSRARSALADYLDIPVIRHPHTNLLERILALHANFTVYDGCYVALAEELDAELVTADAKFGRAAKRILGRRVTTIKTGT